MTQRTPNHMMRVATGCSFNNARDLMVGEDWPPADTGYCLDAPDHLPTGSASVRLPHYAHRTEAEHKQHVESMRRNVQEVLKRLKVATPDYDPMDQAIVDNGGRFTL